MKKIKIAVIVVVFIAAVISSFCLGSHMKEKEVAQNRRQSCRTEISFAMEQAKKEDLSNPDTMETLISNVYAAYVYCDEDTIAGKLHDIWNTLIFQSETYVGNEETLAGELEDIFAVMQEKEK